ncbi:LUD domain-containing protein [Neorhodopirellula lusitana]|nr:LUD domain-containing protein [Neorhodopirellula lusitana]
MKAKVGIMGVNLTIAETGGLVVGATDGNVDLGVSLPRVHVVCTGIEELLPRFEDLALFIRLLTPSATGKPIASYTSHFHGPRDEHGQLRIVLVDNGRSEIRASDAFHDSLNCIR